MNEPTCYDDLDDTQQKIVREEWDKKINEALKNLNLTESLTPPWIECDEQGRVVIRSPQD